MPGEKKKKATKTKEKKQPDQPQNHSFDSNDGNSSMNINDDAQDAETDEFIALAKADEPQREPQAPQRISFNLIRKLNSHLDPDVNEEQLSNEEVSESKQFCRILGSKLTSFSSALLLLRSLDCRETSKFESAPPRIQQYPPGGDRLTRRFLVDPRAVPSVQRVEVDW